MLIERVPVALLRVQTEDIVDHTVAIVVDPIGGKTARLAGVLPHLAGQIGVAVAHAAVDHGDQHVPAGGPVPRARRADHVQVAGLRAGVERVVRLTHRADDAVALDVADGDDPRWQDAIRAAEPEAAFRSSFIVGFPGETEADVDEALREVRLALLEADVALPVVKDFVAHVRTKAVGQDVIKSVTPGQLVIKIVHDELVALLGERREGLRMSTLPPTIVMLVGLQGSGKTTTSAKLAWRLKQDGKTVTLAIADLKPVNQQLLKFRLKTADGSEFKQDVLHTINVVAEAGSILSKRKVGALIVIEAETGLQEYIERSVKLDADLSAELLVGLFLTGSPFHDGATVIRRGRIVAARSAPERRGPLGELISGKYRRRPNTVST